MYSAENMLNELFVKLFNEILQIEQLSLSKDSMKDLSIVEIHTIEAIGNSKERSMSEIAAELKITVGTLTIAINNLTKKGYVERKKVQEDKRLVLVELTRKGKLVNKVHADFHSKMVNQVTSALSEDEEIVLINILQKLIDFFKNEYQIESLKGKNK